MEISSYQQWCADASAREHSGRLGSSLAHACVGFNNTRALMHCSCVEVALPKEMICKLSVGAAQASWLPSRLS